MVTLVTGVRLMVSCVNVLVTPKFDGVAAALVLLQPCDLTVIIHGGSSTKIIDAARGGVGVCELIVFTVVSWIAADRVIVKRPDQEGFRTCDARVRYRAGTAIQLPLAAQTLRNRCARIVARRAVYLHHRNGANPVNWPGELFVGSTFTANRRCKRLAA